MLGRYISVTAERALPETLKLQGHTHTLLLKRTRLLTQSTRVYHDSRRHNIDRAIAYLPTHLDKFISHLLTISGKDDGGIRTCSWHIANTSPPSVDKALVPSTTFQTEAISWIQDPCLWPCTLRVPKLEKSNKFCAVARWSCRPKS